MKGFGLDRAAEPKGSIPVTAWKLDDSPELRPGEMKISVNRIDFERTNFNQICSICGYDEEQVKKRIMKIVGERHKLHNPYTESSDMFSGTIQEIAPEFKGNTELKEGDDIICLTPLAGLPLFLEDITSVDMGYGQIKCRGYVICFESVQLVKQEDFKGEESKYLLRALEVEGSLCRVSRELKRMKPSKSLIIGANPVEAMFYAKIASDSNVGSVDNILVMDSSYSHIYEKESLEKAFGKLAARIYFVDLSTPMEASQILFAGENGQLADVVVNLESIEGAETLANCIVKDNGMVCYTGMSDNYTKGLLIADCFGKEVNHCTLDGYEKEAYPFAVSLINGLLPELFMLDKLMNRADLKKNFAEVKRKERTKNAARKIDDFIYMSDTTETMVEEILNVAQYDCNVIIQGETGVGKEKVFNLIHQNSPRRGKPCIKINCATIQENLAESEFFGYEKGAFTGAHSDGKEGYFELANNGTLFLDEIGSLSLAMQSKLLRVLQENTYYRVGGTQPRHVNVRVVCASNIPLKKLVDEGQFREDLYYRLNICMINVPPLRMRKDDITCLSQAFIKGYSEKYGVKKEFSNDALEELREYHWPGNVRELENTVHRLYISEKEHIIDGIAVDMLINESLYDITHFDMRKEGSSGEKMDFNSAMNRQEKNLIAFALKKCRTTRAAAEFLGIPQATLARKKVKHSL
ncbi:MAG: sigma-54 interaction domain-containing protein [Anaerovoracaceae bacterium]